MKRILPLIFWQFCLLPGANAFADVVMLKDGGQISGTVESGDKWEIRITVAGESKAYPMDQIQSIQFDSPAALITSTAPPQIAPQGITIPAGTEIAVRTIDRINSKTADLNKEYAASLDDPIVVDGVTLAPANANAYLRVTDVRNSRIKGRASLSISLIAVIVNGQRVKVETGSVDSQSGSAAKRTLAGGAIGAGTGAAIGGIAGGAMGAGIGAGVGAVGGAVAGKLTAKPVEIAPETRFTYKLTQAIVVDSQEGPR